MEIFIIRHAIAADASDVPFTGVLPDGIDPEDAARPLTAEGISRFTGVVAGLDRLGVRFDALHHSPLRRAVQTAALLERLGPCVEDPLLAAPPGPELLAGLRGARIGLVGHQPWLGQLLSLLVEGSPHGGAAYTFRKGSVAWVVGAAEPAGATLRGLWSPKVLRAIGGG